MGWCSEFGVEIASCDHPMVAGYGACHCDICGTTCEGKFAGCKQVWARGPVAVEFPRRRGRPSGPRIEADDGLPDFHAAARARETVPPSSGDDDQKELVEAVVQRIETRLDALKLTDLDGGARDARFARLLEQLPRRIGQVMGEVLDARDATANGSERPARARS